MKLGRFFPWVDDTVSFFLRQTVVRLTSTFISNLEKFVRLRFNRKKIFRRVRSTVRDLLSRIVRIFIALSTL